MAGIVRSQEWGTSQGVFCCPQGQCTHKWEPATRYITNSIANSQFFSKINIQSYLWVFFFSLSFGLCNFKGFYHKVHGERMKKKPNPLHVLGLTRAVKCLDRSGSLNAQLALYFRSSVDFNFWLSPLATENKKPTFPPSGQVKNDLQPSKTSTWISNIIYQMLRL